MRVLFLSVSDIRQAERFFTGAAVLLFALFAFLVINHAFFFTMDADEAYNATTAKNWLLGYGYSSSIGVIFPFDPYISSGPAYTFLVAIPIKLFGNNPDVVKPFMAFCHLALLSSCLLLLKPYATSAKSFFWQLFFLLTFFCLVEFKFWHRSAGELLSLLYFVNAALVTALAYEKRIVGAAALGGLLASASVLTKNQAWLLVAGLLLAVLTSSVHGVRQRSLSGRAALKLALVFFLTFLSPWWAWHSYESASLRQLSENDPHLYEYYLGKQWHFFSTHGSGLNLFWEIHSVTDWIKREGQLIVLAFTKFANAFSRLGAYTALGAVGVLLGALFIVVSAAVDFFRFGRIALLFLAMPVLAFTFWALLLNNSIYTHQMLPGIWLSIITVSWVLANKPAVTAALGVLAMGVVFATAGKYGELACMDASNAACVYTQNNPVRSSFENAMRYLKLNKLPAPMANCGWYFAQDVEFSLPAVNNIQDCMRLFDESLEFDAQAFVDVNKLPAEFHTSKTEDDLKKLYVHKRKNLFGASFVAPVRWKKPIEFTYIANIYMTGNTLEQKRNVMGFLEHCKDVLYADQFYYIQHCRFEDLQEYVNEWHGLPIFTHSWEALYYRDFMKETLHQTPLGW